MITIKAGTLSMNPLYIPLAFETRLAAFLVQICILYCCELTVEGCSRTASAISSKIFLSISVSKKSLQEYLFWTRSLNVNFVMHLQFEIVFYTLFILTYFNHYYNCKTGEMFKLSHLKISMIYNII